MNSIFESGSLGGPVELQTYRFADFSFPPEREVVEAFEPPPFMISPRPGEGLGRLPMDPVRGRIAEADFSFAPTRDAQIIASQRLPLTPQPISVHADEEVIAVEVVAAADPAGLYAQADAARQLIDGFSGAPVTRFLENTFPGSAPTPRSVLDAARWDLERAIERYGPEDDPRPLRVAIENALSAFDLYAPGARANESGLREAITGAAGFVRDGSVTVATALFGPVAGGAQAGLTAAFDRLVPGPTMYDAGIIEDVANIASTHGAIRAADWAHTLQPGIAGALAPIIGSLPAPLQHLAATPIARLGGELLLDGSLHLMSDVVAETGGQLAQDILDGRPVEEIAANARSAVVGAGGASIISTLAVEVLDRRNVLPREQLVMIAEAIERVSAKVGVDVAVSQNTAGEGPIAPGQNGLPGPIFAERGPAYFLRQELTQGVGLGDAVPGLAALRHLHGTAALMEATDPGAGPLLPPDGFMDDDAEIATTLAAVLARMSPETAAAFVHQLDLLKTQP